MATKIRLDKLFQFTPENNIDKINISLERLIMNMLILPVPLHTIVAKNAIKQGFCGVALLFLSFTVHAQSNTSNCSTIQHIYDKAQSRVISRAQNGVSMGLMKIIRASPRDTSYYATFTSPGARAGVTLSLDNGKKVTFQEAQSNTAAIGDEPAGTAFVSLTRQDMKQLATTGVLSFNLSSTDQTVSDANRQLIKQQAFCLTYGTSRIP